jgi:hypothetical protein
MLRVSPEAILLYKPLLDAEIIYQLYSGDKLTELITNGVYSLLNYVIPLELVASKAIRLSENGIAVRRHQAKEQIKSEAYFEHYQSVVESLPEYDIGQSIAHHYPQGFHEFCNNPYIKQKPENLNQAAWMVFLLSAVQSEFLDDNMCQLTGLLLAASQIRNEHIHPIRNEPIPVQSPEDVKLMRYVCHRAIELILSINTRISAGRVELRYNNTN